MSYLSPFLNLPADADAPSAALQQPYTYGENPPLTPEEKTEIRRVLGDAWQRDHATKNALADPRDRKAVTQRMRRYEGLMEKVAAL